MGLRSKWTMALRARIRNKLYQSGRGNAGRIFAHSTEIEMVNLGHHRKAKAASGVCPVIVLRLIACIRH